MTTTELFLRTLLLINIIYLGASLCIDIFLMIYDENSDETHDQIRDDVIIQNNIIPDKID